MRLVDAYIDTIIEIRELLSLLPTTETTVDSLSFRIRSMLIESEQKAIKAGYSQDAARAATFPVASLIDEIILTSDWKERSNWKTCSLQRHLFDTTNAGSEFYDRLNLLNRSENDQSIREVYLLCLGLGFKGKYFLPEDILKIKEIRSFHLGALLPADHQSRVDKMILFSDAYQKDSRENKRIKSRFNVLPVIASIPVIIIASIFLVYSIQVNRWVSSIIGLVN